MAAPVPLAGHQFRVHVSSGRSWVEVGCVRVELPPLPATRCPDGTTDEGLLVLQRGFDGGALFTAWWQQHRAATRRPKGRDVTVDLLDASGCHAALRWRFANCRPRALQHSPLDALHPAVLLETLSLSYDDVELSRA